jgi:hypothetical protein
VRPFLRAEVVPDHPLELGKETILAEFEGERGLHARPQAMATSPGEKEVGVGNGGTSVQGLINGSSNEISMPRVTPPGPTSSSADFEVRARERPEGL